ncbi:MAG: phosphopantetheine-binding protein [Myxococcota bacterium]
MTEQDVMALMATILRKQGKATDELGAERSLRDLGFRSLDFSELCLRVEDEMGQELNFEAAQLRGIETVGDVCSFIRQAVGR